MWDPVICPTYLKYTPYQLTCPKHNNPNRVQAWQIVDTIVNTSYVLIKQNDNLPLDSHTWDLAMCPTNLNTRIEFDMVCVSL